MAVYFGLDGEMSAADVDAGGRLIQIGIAAQNDMDGMPADIPAMFSSLINPGDMAWDARAAAVHGYTRDQIEQAPPAADVDQAVVDWLAGQSVTDKRRNAIAVGYNVGSFDLPHVRLVLPRTAALFSRRTVDLNALCFTLEGLPYEGTAPGWSGWKRMASTYAERVIAGLPAGPDGFAAHDAGYDALLHLFAWRFLRAAAHGTPVTMPQTPVGGKDVKRATGALLAAVGTDRAAALTGYAGPTLHGWANGGRVTDPNVLRILTDVLAELAGG